MQKFRKAQKLNQAAIEKYLEKSPSLNSSSEDEDEEAIQKSVDQVMILYQGEGVDVEKVISYLANLFQSGGAVCLICISNVKKVDPIWNCSKCYSFMHLSCILHWIKDSLSYKRESGIPPIWACPKCRMEYTESQVPKSYMCFCKKTLNPSYQPWCIPHSCGDTCEKQLQPICGHSCVLLCHPGPCPPCAQMVYTSCYCGKEPPAPRRCSSKYWTCGKVCNKKLECCDHYCKEFCHSGNCPSCKEIVTVACHCKSSKEKRVCHQSSWRCNTSCGKELSCKIHSCKESCHLPGDCGDCPMEKNRTCPCGKKTYAVSCKEAQVPTCGDTCSKLLNCGVHTCNMRCHQDRCGQCLEVALKTCKCGSFKKEIACTKEFHCNKKCTQIRLCGKHLCNKKCCDCLINNTHNSCEKMCDNTLHCKKHKCSAPCHSGPCYPCNRTDVIHCRCGHNKITVPCGSMKKVKPPSCNKLCKIPPICHHPKRESHKCHMGNCPPCRKICGLSYKKCGHSCPAVCHTKVWTKVRVNGVSHPTGPWEKEKYTLELKTFPCPPCEYSVMVTCLGGHETQSWPCHMSNPASCLRPCDRLLNCTNHKCELLCHKIQAENNGEGTPCMVCEKRCFLPRPESCTHACPKQCHKPPCDPCKQLVKSHCHCGISILFKRCSDLTLATKTERDKLLMCGSQCPRTYPCGHRCIDNCHPGPCRSDVQCNKKHRQVDMNCDEVCQKLKEEKEQVRLAALELKLKQEEMKNLEEIAKFEKKFKRRKRTREKHEHESLSQEGISCYKLFLASTILISILGVVITYVITNNFITVNL
ncbi:NF-X1-type zinc finger protein NFXL1 isoform X2 [Prorops nasuta]|uniref:NF-X1-type zinc finger protein NFXL1 isoform X2 n=1 Tax=Prorops nasuta TaxID=863751 RepID=UPI0034CE8896